MFRSKLSLIKHTCAGKVNLKVGSGGRKLVQRRKPPSYAFICTQCNVKFTRKVTLDDHIIKKHKELIMSVSSKKHECVHCNYKTTIKSKLEKHMLKHASFKFRICEYCNASYKRKEYLDNHIFINHPDVKTSIKRKMHECPECDYKTTKKYSLNMHMLVHPGTKSDLGTCKYCNESFRGKTSLDNHVIKKHPDFITSIKRKIHECSQCNYKTPRKKAMERHTSTHTGAVFKVLICEHCNATFKWEETLDSHIFKNHPDLIASIKRKILECLHCTYKTTFKNTLRKHMIRHSNEPTTLSVCPECYASFKHKVSLHDHILRVHPDLKSFVKRKTHECTQCDYKTIKKQYLTKHMLKHAGIVFKPSVCEHCNASFNSKQTLDSHILRDHPDFVESIKSKIHECSKCSYKTIRKSTLTKHMLTHPSSDSDLIRCQHCNASFKRTVNLDNHVLRKHPDFEASIERKIHECEQCGYKSTLKSIITRHKLTHSSIYPKVCNNM
nr:unnamed protein product [Callosobruchus analis]